MSYGGLFKATQQQNWLQPQTRYPHLAPLPLCGSRLSLQGQWGGGAILIGTPASQAGPDTVALEALQLGDPESHGEIGEPFCLALSLKTRGKGDESQSSPRSPTSSLLSKAELFRKWKKAISLPRELSCSPSIQRRCFAESAFQRVTLFEREEGTTKGQSVWAPICLQ